MFAMVISSLESHLYAQNRPGYPGWTLPATQYINIQTLRPMREQFGLVAEPWKRISPNYKPGYKDPTKLPRGTLHSCAK